MEKHTRIALEEHFATNSFIFLSFDITLKMGRRFNLTETQRTQTVALQQECYSERQIGARIGCSKNAVHNALKKFKKYGSYCDEPKLQKKEMTS